MLLGTVAVKRSHLPLYMGKDVATIVSLDHEIVEILEQWNAGV